MARPLPAEGVRRPLASGLRPRPITVAHLTGETAFSGGEVQLFLLMEGLRKRGHENVLLCPAAGRSAEEAKRRGIDFRPVRARSEWSPRDVWSVWRQLRACAPDMVHLHTGRANWLGGLAAWQLGLPAVTTRRMDRPVKRNPRTRFVYGAGVRRAVAISEAVRAQLHVAGVAPDSTRVIASAVDPSALLSQSRRPALRRELGLDRNALCVLAVAALVPRKGIDVLLEAFARVARERPDPVLWIAGEGPSEAALRRQADRAGLSHRVRWLGQRRDVPDLLEACDVFALPSRREGLGVAALEAMAVGRPVVASRVGGLREAVVDGETGLLVEPADAVSLAQALRRLVDEPALRARLGAAGPPRVEARFRADRMVEAYEDLYVEVLAEAGRL